MLFTIVNLHLATTFLCIRMHSLYVLEVIGCGVVSVHSAFRAYSIDLVTQAITFDITYRKTLSNEFEINERSVMMFIYNMGLYDCID